MKRKLIFLKNILYRKKTILVFGFFVLSFSLFLITNHVYSSELINYSLSAGPGDLLGGGKCSKITLSWSPTGESLYAIAVRKNSEPTATTFNYSAYIDGKTYIVFTNLEENTTYKAAIFNWAGTRASNVVTVRTEPCCTNYCSSSGTKGCSGYASYMTCGNYDSDPCLEWSSSISCPSGQTCSGGNCVSGCSNDPGCTSSGIKRCDPSNNTRYQTCGNYDTSDPCLEWSSSTTCPFGQTCSGAGVCSALPCTNNECAAREKQCTDSTHYKTCGDYNMDGCLEWSSSTVCPSGKTCLGGDCISPPPEVNLNVPYYSQGSYGNEYYVLESGQRKSNYAYNCGGSSSFISNTGCYPTSAAMVLDYYGKNMGVVNTANSCTDNGCHRIDGNCGDPNRPYYSPGSEPYCSAVFEVTGLGSYFIWNKVNGGAPFRAEDLFQITDAIAAGFPVIVNVTHYYGFTHAMVVKGYRIDGQGNVTLYVNDPNGGLWQTISDPSVIQLGQVIYP